MFGPGGEHLHSVCSPRKGSALQHVVWLDDHHVSAATGTEVTVWRVTQDSCEESGMFGANPAGSILSLAPAPDGRYLAAACNNGTVRRRAPAAVSQLVRTSNGLRPQIVWGHPGRQHVGLSIAPCRRDWGRPLASPGLTYALITLSTPVTRRRSHWELFAAACRQGGDLRRLTNTLVPVPCNQQPTAMCILTHFVCEAPPAFAELPSLAALSTAHVCCRSSCGRWATNQPSTQHCAWQTPQRAW
jgi:hypothetical protein